MLITMIDPKIDNQSEPMLVLCHSFFHDAFRNYPVFEIETYKNSVSARAVARAIINRQAELPEGRWVAVTSKTVFDSFLQTFELEAKGGERYEIVEILKNTILVLPDKEINDLTVDDGIIALADILYNRSKYNPVILVTNIPSKMQMCIDFYKKTIGVDRFKETDIQFILADTQATELFLKTKFPQ